MFRNKADSANKGAAIILVLIIIAISFSLSAFYLRKSKNINSMIETYRNKLTAKMNAESALQIMDYIGATQAPDCLSFKLQDTVLSQFADNGTLKIGGEPTTLLNTEIYITDTAASFSPMSFNENLFIRLLSLKGYNRSRLSIINDSIADWKDSDDLSHLNGAEKSFYNNNFKYVPRNSSAIQHPDELKLIQGLNDNVSARIIDSYFTYSPLGVINICSADPYFIGALFNLTGSQTQEVASLIKHNKSISIQEILSISGNNDYDIELVTQFSSRVLRIKAVSKVGEAKEISENTVNFRGNTDSPFTVLNRKN
jgi:general secretion pathway protein K